MGAGGGRLPLATRSYRLYVGIFERLPAGSSRETEDVARANPPESPQVVKEQLDLLHQSLRSPLREARMGFDEGQVVNYNVRLGNSLFFRPGVGAGYFFGTRERPGATLGTKIESTISGPAALLDLTLQYFASPNFSMRAGPVLVMRFGSEAPDAGGDAQSYTQIDAGFTAGLAYSF